MSCIATADDAVLSDITTYLARLPSVMAHRASSTRYEIVEPESSPSPYQRQPSSSATPTQSTSNHSRDSSTHSVQYALGTQPAPQIQLQRQASEHPTSQNGELPNGDTPPTSHHAPPPPSPRLGPTNRSMISLNGSAQTSPSRIKVRDLSHIQSFASEEVLTRSRHPSRPSLKGKFTSGQQYEISSMPVQDIIEMVAGLLTKITTTNDRQHEHLHRHIPPPDGSTPFSQQATSVLAFHGKKVPSITIASCLSRIHKYCPTTYEVFLSLLVYFDRMTEIVNCGSMSSFAEHGPYSTPPPAPC